MSSFLGFEIRRRPERLDAIESRIAALELRVMTAEKAAQESDVRTQNLCKEFVKLNETYQSFTETFVSEVQKLRAASSIKNIMNSNPLFSESANAAK